MREWMVKFREWLADPIEVNNCISFQANNDKRRVFGHRYRYLGSFLKFEYIASIIYCLFL